MIRWKGQRLKMGLRRGNIPSTEIVQFSFTESNVENYGSVLELLPQQWSKSQDPKSDLTQTRRVWGSSSTKHRFQERSCPGRIVWNLKSTIADVLKCSKTVQEQQLVHQSDPGNLVGGGRGGRVWRTHNFDTSQKKWGQWKKTNSNYSFREKIKMITLGSFVTFVFGSALTDVARSRTCRHSGTKQNCQECSASGLYALCRAALA